MLRLKRKLSTLPRFVVILSLVGVFFVFYSFRTVLNGKDSLEESFPRINMLAEETRKEQHKRQLPIKIDDDRYAVFKTTRNFDPVIENMIDVNEEEVSSSLSKLNIFDSARYEIVQHSDIQAPGTCVQSGLQPHFTICVYEKKVDKWISGGILESGKWEPGISLTIRDIISNHGNEDILVLDVGANLGVHGLYVANMGFRVWAVEPQERNLIKMYRSAEKSGILDYMTFVQNGVDEVRRQASMHIDNSNNGGSFVKLGQEISEPSSDLSNESQDQVDLQTVLLGDIFKAVKDTVTPIPSQLLMKIDVELFECKAFLGSPEVLKQPQEIPLLAVIMEWVFLRETGVYSEQCPKESVIELAKMFLDNGYTPYHVNGDRVKLSKLDSSNFGLEWNCNVAWLPNSIFED